MAIHYVCVYSVTRKNGTSVHNKVMTGKWGDVGLLRFGCLWSGLNSLLTTANNAGEVTVPCKNLVMAIYMCHYYPSWQEWSPF